MQVQKGQPTIEELSAHAKMPLQLKYQLSSLSNQYPLMPSARPQVAQVVHQENQVLSGHHQVTQQLSWDHPVSDHSLRQPHSLLTLPEQREEARASTSSTFRATCPGDVSHAFVGKWWKLTK